MNKTLLSWSFLLLCAVGALQSAAPPAQAPRPMIMIPAKTIVTDMIDRPKYGVKFEGWFEKNEKAALFWAKELGGSRVWVIKFDSPNDEITWGWE